MADYFTPTVVQPMIPNADMTPLERLILSHVFEAEEDGDCTYFYSSDGPNDLIRIDRRELEEALASSEGVGSEASSVVEDRIAKLPAEDNEIELDLSGPSWEVFLQDIVGRSPSLQYVSVVSAFTCSKMCPDGYGGMAVLITEDRVMGKSTGDIIEDFLGELDGQDNAGDDRAGPYVLLQFDEGAVHEEIRTAIETDSTLTTLPPEAIRTADIRAACRRVVEQSDLSEERGSAVFRAALGAIREAERRRQQLP
jgi:hypothetical protein